MIRKLKDGRYRLYSKKTDPKTKKRRNLGTFATRAAAEKHEKAVQFFKRKGSRCVAGSHRRRTTCWQECDGAWQARDNGRPAALTCARSGTDRGISAP